MGLWSTSGATITATNNILAHTSPPGANTYGVRVTSGATATLSYNDVWTHTIQYSSVAAPASDIQQDPPFLDWPNDDFHLQSSSPAVDAGVDAGVTTDIDGDPRPIGLPDIGIDEYVQWIYLPLVLRNY